MIWKRLQGPKNKTQTSSNQSQIIVRHHSSRISRLTSLIKIAFRNAWILFNLAAFSKIQREAL